MNDSGPGPAFPSVWAVVLAAGESRRLGGRPKQLVELDGEPLVRRAARTALEAGVAQVAVVVGAMADAVARALKGLGPRVFTVFNPDYPSGIAGSLRAGLGALPPAAGAALILLADQPRVDAPLLVRVLGAAQKSGAAACRYPDGRLGTPAVLHRRLWGAVAALRGDRGARAILSDPALRVAAVPADPEQLWDLDLPDDLARLGAGTPS